MSLVTLAQIKEELKATTTSAAEDNELIRRGNVVTRRWLDVTGMDFEPMKRSRLITPTSQNLLGAGRTLRLPAPLLVASSISVGGVALTYGTDVIALTDDSSKPIGYLRLADTYAGEWLACGVQTYVDSIVIDGIWGYRTNYATEGWVDTLATLAVNITDTTTKTFTASDVDGTDDLYRSPALSAGGLWKIDDEIFVGQATNTTTNVATARRGQRGTTAANHTAGAKIYTWNPEPEVAEVCARAACFKFARKGAFQNVEISPDGAAVKFPIELPNEFYSVAQGYVYGY